MEIFKNDSWCIYMKQGKNSPLSMYCQEEAVILRKEEKL